MPDRVDAVVERVESASVDAAPDRRTAEAYLKQLPTRYDAVLPFRAIRDPLLDGLFPLNANVSSSTVHTPRMPRIGSQRTP
jgi:hypothetical protein